MPASTSQSAALAAAIALCTSALVAEPAEATEASKGGRKLTDEYEIGPRIGKGASAVVRRGRHLKTRREVAIKEVRKSTVNQSLVETEIEVMQKVGSNPHVAVLIDVFETHASFFLVMELAQGGELFERLASKGPYSEQQAAEVVRQIGDALAFLHAQGVCHRDLKPENVLLKDRSDDSEVRLVDFGLSRQAAEADKAVAGTWAYWSPEAMKGEAGAGDPPLDMWALGCILYILLSGYHPFDPTGDAPDHTVQANIANARFDFDDDAWKHVSEPAKDLVTRLLTQEPKKRLTVEGLMRHHWVVGDAASRSKLAGSDRRLRSFVDSHRRLRAAAFAVMLRTAAQLEHAHGEDGAALEATLLANVFRMFDREGKGFIDAGDVQRVMYDDLGTNVDEADAASLISGEAGDKGPGPASGEGPLGKMQSLIQRWSSSSKLPAEEPMPVRSRVEYGEYLSMMAATTRQTYRKGEVVCREGDEADCFYLLIRGQMDVHRSAEGGKVATLKAGSFFGETALLSGGGRSATCFAGSNGCEVLVLSNDDFEALVGGAGAGAVARRPSEVFGPDPAAAQVAGAGPGMATISRDLTREEQELRTQQALNFIRIASRTTRKRVRAGEYVFHQGDIADMFYILLEGELRIDLDGHTLKTVAPGDCFGEMGILHNAPRNADVIAVQDSICIALTSADLMALLTKSSALKSRIGSIASARAEQLKQIEAVRRHAMGSDDSGAEV